MAGSRSRRSRRVAMTVPIRVYGIDFHGIDFMEDSLTVVVNQHGAKIRLNHQLLPDSEILVFSHPTRREGFFRVVSKLETLEPDYSYWGIENLDPERNLWGVDIPQFQPGDESPGSVVLKCPTCSARESLQTNETLLTSLQERGGVNLTCKSCGELGLWRLLPREAT